MEEQLHYTIDMYTIKPTRTSTGESSFLPDGLKLEDIVTFHIVLNHRRPDPTDRMEDDCITSSSITETISSEPIITTFSHPFHHPDYLPLEYYIRSICPDMVNGFLELPSKLWDLVRDQIINYVTRMLLGMDAAMKGFEMAVDVDVVRVFIVAPATTDDDFGFLSMDEEDLWYSCAADGWYFHVEEEQPDHQGGKEDGRDVDHADDEGEDDGLEFDHIIAGIEALFSS